VNSNSCFDPTRGSLGLLPIKCVEYSAGVELWARTSATEAQATSAMGQLRATALDGSNDPDKPSKPAETARRLPVISFMAVVLALFQAPRVGWGLIARPWALPLHGATGVAAVAAIYALWKRRYVSRGRLLPPKYPLYSELGTGTVSISCPAHAYDPGRGCTACHTELGALGVGWRSGRAVALTPLPIPDLQSRSLTIIASPQRSWFYF